MYNYFHGWIIWKIDRDVEFTRYLHHDPHVREKHGNNRGKKNLKQWMILHNYQKKKLKNEIPWAGGLGSCSGVELLYSDRKSCVDFLPARVPQGTNNQKISSQQIQKKRKSYDQETTVGSTRTRLRKLHQNLNITLPSQYVIQLNFEFQCSLS